MTAPHASADRSVADGTADARPIASATDIAPAKDLPGQDRDDGPDDRKFVVALSRGLEVLEAFTAEDRVLSNGILAQRTGLPKSTVTRLTYTLAHRGYLRHDADAQAYALDAAAFRLGQAFRSGIGLLAVLREPMRDIAREVGAAISIGCRDGFDMIYLDTIRSETALTLGLAPGSRLSMLTSSMGRAYLAVQNDAEREHLFAAMRVDAKVRRDVGDVESAIAGARRGVAEFAARRCCFSFQDWHPDVNAVAVPFRDNVAHRWLVLSCSGPASSMPPSRFERDIAPRLHALVSRWATP